MAGNLGTALKSTSGVISNMSSVTHTSRNLSVSKVWFGYSRKSKLLKIKRI
jgi:hypothetical protein